MKFLKLFLSLDGISQFILSLLLSIIIRFVVNDLSFIMIFILLYASISMIWFYIAGYLLFLKSNGKMKMSMLKYKVLGTYLLIYPLIFAFFIINNDNNPNAFFALLPFHLLAMYAGFYQFRFEVVALKTVETKRQVSIADCGDILYSLWKPFGRSKIHPRIQDALGIEPIFKKYF